jgi:hypothetical protein
MPKSNFSNLKGLFGIRSKQKERSKKAKAFRERVKDAPGSQPTASQLAIKKALEKREKKK